MICIAYLSYCAIDNFRTYASEEERIFSSIRNEDTEIGDVLLMKEKEDGVFCLATAKQDIFTLVLASLKRDGIISRIFDTGYTSNIIYLNPKKAISSDPLKINKMPLLFNRKSCWYGFCTDESAKKLKINGEILEADKVEFNINKRNYSGYFWFYESVYKPTVELVG